LSDITFADSVETFGTMCLYRTGISTVTFPKNTKLIGTFAIMHSTKLKEINILQKDPSKLSLDVATFNQGSDKNHMIRNIPWTTKAIKDKGAPWGAENATFVGTDGELRYEGGNLIV
jgi:hypothetical protein